MEEIGLSAWKNICLVCTIMMSSRYRCVVCWFWVAGTYLAHSKWNRERGQRKESRAQLQNKLAMFHRYFPYTFWKLILGTSQQFAIWRESARIHKPSRYALGMSQECILDTCALWELYLMFDAMFFQFPPGLTIHICFFTFWRRHNLKCPSYI